MKEADIQRKIAKYIEGEGGFIFKTISCNKNGIPDLIACISGQFVAIEVKKDGNDPSVIQLFQMDKIIEAGGKAFVAKSVEDVIACL